MDDGKKVKTPKKLKANEIETEQGLKWWKETKGAGNVQFSRLDRGANFQVPKDRIPKVSKESTVPMPFDAPTPQVRQIYLYTFGCIFDICYFKCKIVVVLDALGC